MPPEFKVGAVVICKRFGTVEAGVIVREVELEGVQVFKVETMRLSYHRMIHKLNVEFWDVLS
jgi:hypothetical protein